MVRADALLPGHGEDALRRADRRANEKADDEDEEERIAVDEAGSEQGKDRLAEDEERDRHQQRRPERPMQRVAQERLHADAVTGGVVLRDPLRRAGAHREIDEVHDGERTHHGEIDAGAIRFHQRADDQDVDIGEKVEEALDQEDRQRDGDPMDRLERARAGRHGPLQPAAERQRLEGGDGVGGHDRRSHRGDRVGRPPERDGQPHDEDDRQRPQDDRSARAPDRPS